MLAPVSVNAAAKAWDGGGADNNWSTCANWNLDVCPVAADTVTFNATSTKDSVIDAGFAGTITSITIASGYTGTLSLGRATTVTGAFSQATGTFTGNNYTLTVASFTLSGGTFNSTSGIFNVNSNITISGASTFNHNSGTVNLASTGTSAYSCNNVVFNLVTVNKTSGNHSFTNCALPVGNNPTITTTTGGSLTFNTSSITGTGTITFATNVLIVLNTSSLNGFDGIVVLSLNYNSSSTDFSSYTTFTLGGSLALTASSTITLPNLPISVTTLTITNSTLNSTSSVLTTSGVISITGTGAFNHNNGSLVITGSGTNSSSCNNVVFNSVTINKSNGNLTLTNCSLPLGSNPTVTTGPGNSIILNGSSLVGTGTITFNTNLYLTMNTSSSLVGFSGLSVFGLTVSGSTADFSGYSTFAFAGGPITLTSSAVLVLPNINVTIDGLTITSSTFTTTSSTLNVNGTINISGASTFNHNNGVVNITGTGTETFSCNSVTFNSVTITKSQGSVTLNSCTFPVGNNPTISNGNGYSFIMNSSSLVGTGTITFVTTIYLSLNTSSALTGFSGLSVFGLTVSNSTANFSSYSPFTLGGPVSVTSSAVLTLPNSNITMTDLTITNSTLTSTSSSLNLTGLLNITGASTFNHNNGIVNFTATGTETYTCNNVVFNSVTITKTSGATTLNSCTFPLGNNPTVSSGSGFSFIMNSSSLVGTGTLTFSISLYLNINSGSSLVGFSGLNVFSLSTSGVTADFSSFSPFTLGGPLSMVSSTITVPNVDINVTTFTQTNSTFTSTSGALNISDNIAITGTGTFNHNNGTVNLIGSSTISYNCNNAVFNQVNITRTSGTISLSNCSLPIGNNPTITQSAGFSFNLGNSTIIGTGTLTFASGNTLNLTSTGTLSGFSGLVVENLVVNGASANYSSYTNFTIPGSITLTSGSLSLPQTTSTGVLTTAAGTLTASSGVTTISSTMTLAGITFNHNGGSFNFTGSTATLSCNNYSFNSVAFNNTGVKTVSSNCNFPLGNNPTITNGVTLSGTLSGTGTLTTTAGTLTLSSGSVVTGFTGFNLTNLTMSGPTIDAGAYSQFAVSGTLSLTAGALRLPDDSSISTLTVSGGTFNTTTGDLTLGALTISGSPTFNAPTGTLTILGTLTISNTPTFNHNSGIVNFTGSAVTLSCNNVSFNRVTLNNTGLLTISSNCNFPLGANPTIANSVTLSGTLSGTGLVTMPIGTLILNSGSTFSGFSGLTGSTNSLTINNTTANWGAYTQLDIGGNFILTGTAPSFTAPSGDLNLYGNFSHLSGTFTHNNGNFNLVGGNQTISGIATTFYNLSKIVTTADIYTLTLPANITLTVVNNTTFNGYDISNRLLLRTSSGTTQWKIDPQGARSFLFVDLKDAWNTNVIVVEVGGSGSYDSGHNSFFSFGDLVPNAPTNLGPIGVISAIYTTTLKPNFTFTITDPNFLDTVKYNIQIDNDSDFSSPVVNYTSALISQGTKSFTVGQNSGSGTYTDGAPNQSLTTGAYYWRVNNTDDTGMFSAYTAGNSGSIAFYVDATAPDAFTPTLNVTSPTTNTTPIVTFNTTDNVAVNYYQVKVDSGSFSTRTSPYTLPELAAGAHTITVRAFDTTGNFTDGIVLVTVELNAPDPFTPTLNVTSPTNNQTPIVSFSTTDDAGIDHYEVKIDSGSFTTQTSPYQLPTLSSGSRTITVRAYNINNSYTDGTVVVYIDITSPNIFTPTTNVGTYTTDQSPTITFNATDSQTGIDHYELNIDESGFTTRTSPYTISPDLAEGTHTITVRAYDNAGNFRDGTILTINIDLTSPDAFIPTLNVSSPTSNTRPTVSFSTTDNFLMSYYQVKVDEGSFSTQTSPYQVPQLSAGDHTITVRAFDAAGNYTDGEPNLVNIDESGPDAFTPSLSPVSPTNDTTPDLSFSTTDNNGIDYYQVKIDSGSFTTQTSPYTLPTLAAGSHTATVRAFDLLGNYTDGSISIVIDTTAPHTFSPTLNTGSNTNNTSPIVSFTTTDTVGMGYYQVKVDGGAYETQTSPFQLPLLSLGSHSISVRAYDAAGNYRDGTVLNITVDTIAPDSFTPTLNVVSPTINTTPTITFSTDDNIGVSYYRVKVDGGNFATKSSPNQLEPLSNGSHTITVRAYDAAGNYTEGSVNVTVDRTSPDPFTPTLDGTSPINTTTPTINFEATDSLGIDHYEVKIDNGSYTTQESPYTLPSLSENTYNGTPHTVTVRAYNTLGNSTDGIISFKVDVTAPTITYYVARKYNNADIQTTFYIQDNIGAPLQNVNATGGNLSCTQTHPLAVRCTVTTSQSGDVTVNSTDSAGNLSSITVTDYVIETTPPVIQIVAPTKTSATTITDTTIIVTDNTAILADNVRAISGGTILCNQTNSTRVDCTASISDTGNLVINATDNANNAVALTETGYSVASTPPAAFTPSLNTTPFTNNTAPILYFATTDGDGIDHYEVKIDSGSFTSQVSPYQLPTLAVGFRTITVRAFDTQGNFRDGTVNVTIENTYPEDFTPTLNVSNPTNVTDPELSFFTTDVSGISHYEVQIDEGVFVEQESPYQLPTLTEGEHNIVVRAYNTVGNYTDGIIDLTIDLTAPDPFTPQVDPGEITSNSTPDLLYSTTDNVGISHYEVQVDSGDFSIQASPYSVPTIPEGDHTLSVMAFDLAGNTTSGFAAATIDLSAPVISFTSPTKLSNNPITDTTINITDDIAIETVGISSSGGAVDCTQTDSVTVDCSSVVTNSGTFTIYAYDVAGNFSYVDITDYLIDSSGPSIVITAPTKSSTSTITDTTIRVTDNFSILANGVSATGGSINCTQTTGTQINCTSSISDSGDLLISATDVSGNNTQVIESGYLIATDVPAAFTPTLNTSAITSNRTPTVSFSTTDVDGINHYEVRIDSGSFSTQSSPYQLPELQDGFHTITVRAFSNNSSFRDGTVSVTIDNEAPIDFTPTLNVVSPTNNQTPILSFTTTDNNGIDHYEVKIDSGSFSTRTSPYQLPSLSEGAHTITVRAYDVVGNYKDGSIDLTIDLTPPSAFTPTLNVSSPTNNRTPQIFFSTTDAVLMGHYELQIDSGSFNIQTSPYTLPTLNDGDHTITVNAYDFAGNQRSSSVNLTIELDGPANFTPTFNVTSPTNNTTPILQFSTTAPAGIDHYELQINSGTFTTQTSPYQLSELSEGNHVFRVRAIDIAGNLTLGTVNLTVDLTPPNDFTPVLNVGSLTNNPTPTLQFNTTDNVAMGHFEVQINSGAFTTQTSPYILPGLSNGNHSITVVAYDAAGNSRNKNIGVSVDSQTPTINYVSPTKVSTVNITDTVIQITDNLGIHADDINAMGGIISCEQVNVTSVTCTSVVSQSGTLVVSAIDTAGNTASSSIEGYIIDVQGPQITINAPTKTSSATITDTTLHIVDNYIVQAEDITATGGVIQCSNTNSSTVDCTVSISDSGNLTINAVDSVNNESNAIEQNYLITGSVPAAFIPTLNTGSYTTNKTPILSFETTDADGINHYEVKIDNGTFSTQTSPYQLPELSEGFHSITVRAFSNNTSFRDGTVNVTVDLTNPTSISLLINVQSPTNNQNPIIYFAATDENGVDHYEVKVESEAGQFIRQTSPYTIPTLTEELHKITVKAFDLAGNTLETAQELLVDITSPEGSMYINNKEELTEEKSVVLHITATDNLSGIKDMVVSENSEFIESNYEPFSETKVWTLSNNPGLKTIYIKFIDNAGNESKVYSNSITYIRNVETLEDLGSEPTIIEQIQTQIIDIAKNELPTALVTTTIVAVAANIAAYPKFITYGLFLIRFRRKKKTWGIVYDNHTKRPIEFASVKIYSAESKQFLVQRVTDTEGKYGFVLDKGNYIIEVKQGGYKTFNQTFEYLSQEGTYIKDIALEPEVITKAKVNSINIKQILYSVNSILVYGGFALSIVALIANVSIINIFIVLLYVAQFVVIRRLRRPAKEWGYIYSSHTNQRIKGAFVRVYDVKNSRQVEVVITDEMGRYVFNKLKPGEYLINVYADGYTFPSKNENNVVKGPTGESFKKVMLKKNGQINIEIPLDPSKNQMQRPFLK